MLENEEVNVSLVPIKALCQGINTISISSIEPVPSILKRAELAVQYGSIEEFGCF